MQQRIYLEPTNCECESDKSCDVGKYLGYENCKCRKKLVDKLIERKKNVPKMLKKWNWLK